MHKFRQRNSKLLNVKTCGKNWGSSVSIVTSLRTGRQGFDACQDEIKGYFSSPDLPGGLWDPSIPLSVPTVKLPGRETDHLSSSSTEVKNAWSCYSTPPCILMTWCSVKHTISLNGVALS
jgi:hypothetical protein